MSGKYFLDTNILVYCFAWNDRTKQKRAEDLVAGAVERQLGIISTQVVQEFLSVASRKFATPLKPAEAKNFLATVLAPMCEVFPTIGLYERALELREDTKFSFYDCLILAAAIQGDCNIVYSEDMQDGRKIHGLTIVNPFAAKSESRKQNS